LSLVGLRSFSSHSATTQVLEQVPADGDKWQPVKAGKWMPFDGGSSNGGKWLHAPDREVVATADEEPKLACPLPSRVAHS